MGRWVARRGCPCAGLSRVTRNLAQACAECLEMLRSGPGRLTQVLLAIASTMKQFHTARTLIPVVQLNPPLFVNFSGAREADRPRGVPDLRDEGQRPGDAHDADQSHRRLQVQNTVPSLYGFQWVLADSPLPWATTAGGGLETHGMACNRVGLVPTAREVVLGGSLQWNATTAAALVAALGFGTGSPLNTGCCAASLWCTASGCVSHHWGGNTYINYGFFDAAQRPLYTCTAPTFDDLNNCAQDFSQLCPQGWTPQSNGFVCVAPPSYAGPCLTTAVLGMYAPGARQQWAQQCQVSWPTVCSPTIPPQLDSVEVLSIGAGSVQLHVSGTGFGDNEEDVEVDVGNSKCTDIEVCHTVCRPCSTDADCGNDGLCLSVTGVSGSFCSVFCDTGFSCPCDTQCHEAYAGNSPAPYYFCLNPNVQLVSDLCGTVSVC